MRLMLPFLLCLVLASSVSAQERRQIRLVVPQVGQTLVSDTRKLNLGPDRGTITLDDFAPGMDPSSFHIRSITDEGRFKVFSTVHLPPIAGPVALLKAHIGQVLSIVIPDGLTRDGRVRKQAKLLAAEEAPVFLVDGVIYAGPVESIQYPPQNLSPSPRIAISYANSGPRMHTVESRYLTSGLDWRMDYDLVSDQNFRVAALSGFATIANRSGAPFLATSLELLAGDLGQSAGKRFLRAAAQPMFLQEDAAMPPAEALFEHHLYKLPGLFDLPDQGLLRIALCQSNKLSAKRLLVARASAVPSGNSPDPTSQSVHTLITFRNIASEGLGLPMPKGTIRVYQVDNGSSRLVGEAALDRIPAGGKVEVALGQAFDITIERTAKSYERIGKNSFKGSWELAIRNSKPDRITLLIQESFPGKWKVTESSHKTARSTARAAEFVVDVPPTGEGQPTRLNYSFTLDM